MGSRPGFVIDHTEKADGGQPPNRYADLISVQVRCNWPPRADRDQVLVTLARCYAKAVEEFDSLNMLGQRDG